MTLVHSGKQMDATPFYEVLLLAMLTLSFKMF